MGFYLHYSLEGLTIIISIIYFILVAKVVMVNGSKKIPMTKISTAKKQLNSTPGPCSNPPMMHRNYALPQTLYFWLIYKLLVLFVFITTIIAFSWMVELPWHGWSTSAVHKLLLSPLVAVIRLNRHWLLFFLLGTCVSLPNRWSYILAVHTGKTQIIDGLFSL